MANKIKSRWADSKEDVALETQRKKDREAKKRLKEITRKLEAEKKTHEAAGAAQHDGHGHNGENEADGAPPAKRRRLSMEAIGGRAGDVDMGRAGGSAKEDVHGSEKNFLRFEGGGFGACRSVENFGKLNDIEEGAYGWVARAKELSTGKVVALKRLKMDPKDPNGLSVTGLREIQILRDCEHKNIVKLQEVVVGQDPSRIDSIFLVLEFVEHDLKSILDDMPEPFLASEVKTLLHQLASGVAYLHDHWILHRDLKTSNLLLNNRGRLKIADFGMARYVGDPRPSLTQLVVTLWYRPPELLLGETVYDASIDMWSVGCVLGELIAREPLLPGRNEADQLARIFELCGVPTKQSWPSFRRLPNASALRIPPQSESRTNGSVVRAKFPLLTTAGAALLEGLLALDPVKRLSARAVLDHDYFKQVPKPKKEAMFPTFPSKAGQERRRTRQTPNAPIRGQQAGNLGSVDLRGVFAGREKEERGAGFSLRML